MAGIFYKKNQIYKICTSNIIDDDSKAGSKSDVDRLFMNTHFTTKSSSEHIDTENSLAEEILKDYTTEDESSDDQLSNESHQTSENNHSDGQKMIQFELMGKVSPEPEENDEELPLFQNGELCETVEGWKSAKPWRKMDMCDGLKKLIADKKNHDIQIKVGRKIFYCNLILLQSYSEFFRDNLSNQSMIILPEEEISTIAFEMIYAWICDDNPKVQRMRILEVFKGANFLHIEELINQCWNCFDNDSLYNEVTAFLTFTETKKHGLDLLGRLLLGRIKKTFLTVVATKDFLDLTEEDVCELLSMNTIGVNTELEVLMSAIHWLSYNWEERKSSVLSLVSCVRFGLMTAASLASLYKQNDCYVFQQVIQDSEVIKMIDVGMLYASTLDQFQCKPELFQKYLEEFNISKLSERRWIYDKKCEYHHDFKCRNVTCINYDQFMDYMQMLNNAETTHWSTLRCIDELD